MNAAKAWLWRSMRMSLMTTTQMTARSRARWVWELYCPYTSLSVGTARESSSHFILCAIPQVEAIRNTMPELSFGSGVDEPTEELRLRAWVRLWDLSSALGVTMPRALQCPLSDFIAFARTGDCPCGREHGAALHWLDL